MYNAPGGMSDCMAGLCLFCVCWPQQCVVQVCGWDLLPLGVCQLALLFARLSQCCVNWWQSCNGLQVQGHKTHSCSIIQGRAC